jgi:hypothetical protein
MKFRVSYELVTAESAENGDAAKRGIVDDALTLRDAIIEVRRTRTNCVGGIESISAYSWPARAVRWITVDNSAEYETGARESRTLHLPATITPASSRRIARLMGICT